MSSLETGDVLLGWARNVSAPDRVTKATGSVRDVAEFRRLEIEQLPRGEVMVRVLREGKELTLPFAGPPGEVEIRPAMPAQLLEIYEVALARAAAGELDAAVRELRALAGRSNDDELSAWLLLRAGRLLRQKRRHDDALELLSQAEEASRALAEDSLLLVILDVQGSALEDAGRLEAAAEVYREILERRRQAGVGDLAIAEALTDLGLVQCQLGRTAEGLELLREALEARSRQAPGSLVEADSLNNLGNYEPDPDRQREYHLAALDIRRRRAPGSVDVGASLNNLGNLAWHQGDLARAEARLEEALSVFERLEPESRFVAGTLGNLALVAADRGDLESAQTSIRRALDILRELEPDGAFYLRGLATLANILRQQGDLESAERYHREALERAERRAPESFDVAIALLNLGNIESERDHFDAARSLYERALVLYEEIAPDSVAAAIVHNNLGSLLERGEKLPEARESYVSARAIWQRAAPGSLRSASALLNLGNLERRLGRLDAAEGQLQAGLEIVERLAPESVWMSMVARDLGRLRRQEGRPEAALSWYRRAIATLEMQQGRLGGDTESRGRFRSGHLETYAETVELLLEMGREVEAFEVHERSRAQGMLAMLAERDLVLDSDLPEGLRRERRRLRAEYDRLQERLAGLSPQTGLEEVETALAELRAIRLRQREADAEARRLSPRLRTVQRPEPLDLATMHRRLLPGTVVLSYSVGTETSLLFVLDVAGGLGVHRLEIGDQELGGLVRRFLDLITSGRATPETLEPLHHLGRDLYRLLVAPSEDAVAVAERLLVVPDGPLHTLPFAALVTEDRESERTRHLLEVTPLQVAPSVTAAIELGGGREAVTKRSTGTPVRLVAFGDPALPGPETSVAARRLAAIGADDRGSLPASRREAEAIARLFGDGAELYLGERASEQRAKEIGNRRDRGAAGPAVLHFATHGFVDRRFPLDSGLVLSPAGGENGLLQAWEIFEELRVDAELVTLSGCETAKGAELAGEGLMGLTRAFHYAGARSVVASLWSVPDLSTSALMARFYRHLLAGQSKAEALQRAQLELLSEPVEPPSPDRGVVAGLRALLGRTTPGSIDARHPYHWAAFQLYGAP